MKTQSDAEKRVAEWLKHQEEHPHSVDLSIVVPAFNEERRLPPTLIDMIDFLDARGASYEIIVVDDGSSDGTHKVVEKFERIRAQVRSIKLPDNREKGHAVRIGILNARGRLVLFADADGTAPITELPRLEAALNEGSDIAIGSRAVLASDTFVKTVWYRKLLGRTFNAMVNLVLLPGIADTQCGFKLFRADVARWIFEHQRTDGYGFDVEILYIARKAGFSIAEIPINWSNIPGSKVNLVLDSSKMALEVFVLLLRHWGLKEPRDVVPSSKQKNGPEGFE